MKSVFKSLVLVGAVVALGGCTVTCDHKGGYEGGPYAGTERSAGSGVESYPEQCHWGGNRESYVYSDEKTTASDGEPQADSSVE